MKKFVSIVIALVMVLSMTSAFALSDCSVVDFSWDCPATYSWCGKAVVEVVPYVHTNADCDGDEYVVSECATAIKGENVYYAIKLTVDAYPNAKWFNDLGNIEVTSDGFKSNLAWSGAYWTGIDMTEDEEVVYYLENDFSTWTKAKDATFDLSGVVFKSVVKTAADAEVCAELTSYNDGKDVWTYGDYTVDATNAPAKLVFSNDEGEKLTLTTTAGKISKIDATSDAFFAAVVRDFGLNNCAVGTCINDENIEANFGWDDEQEDCFGWDTKGASVVNPECSVEIPKTGDVSVVAYAVMAIVAAAGTMLKK